MPSSRRQTCWPNQFFVKWLAVLFGSVLIGIALGAVFYHKPAPEPVQIHLEALAKYTDGNLPVPAEVWTAGSGADAVQGAYLGKMSTDQNDLLAMSRTPGSRLWIIARWNGMETQSLVDPWPKSTITWRVAFTMAGPMPRAAKPR